MKIKSALMVASMAALAAISSANASTTVYQSVPNFSLGQSNSEWCSDCYGGGTFEPLDQFTLSNSASISGLTLATYAGYSPYDGGLGSGFTFEVYNSSHSSIVFSEHVMPTLVATNGYDDIVSAKITGLNLAAGTYWAGFIAPTFAVSGFNGGNGSLIDTTPHTGNDLFALGGNTGYALTGGVPETSTWMMMLAGFAGLGFVGYRRNKTASVAA